MEILMAGFVEPKRDHRQRTKIEYRNKKSIKSRITTLFLIPYRELMLKEVREIIMGERAR
jgi:hypothetical protein